MTTLLSEKEDSLRKLKETLRKTQQEGEESCQFTMFDVLLRQSALVLTPAGDSHRVLLCQIQSCRVRISMPG